MGMVVNSFVFANGDLFFSSTKLLLGFDGTPGDNTVVDESAAAHSTVFGFGNATKSATAKFGSASFVFDGSGDKIEFPDSSDWNFGSGDFTIEAWIRFTSLTGFQTICSQWESISLHSWLFDWSPNVLRLGLATASSGADTFVQKSWTPTTGTFYHVVAERSGNTIRLYVDGGMLGTSGSFSGTLFNSSTSMTIGSLSTSGLSTTNGFKGFIDELRITKGIARYASDSGYTVPTAAFPRS